MITFRFRCKVKVGAWVDFMIKMRGRASFEVGTWFVFLIELWLGLGLKA